ncbi:MAG: hypothetical protein GEV06_00265 [Luteitalea sp.]|nr:hypothetical protein [Luteitalea sp.]
MRRLLYVLRALLLAVGAGLAVVILTLPPNPRDLGQLGLSLLDGRALTDSQGRQAEGNPGWSPETLPATVAGAYHIHTTRSDGSGSVNEVAAAAASAGLQFVVLTDHGDATRGPDPPRYSHGVLVLDAVEISTAHGHYVALDLPAAPYPLAGEARDVAEDVQRLGGFGVAAHPDSRKANLAWTDWSVPIDGLEWLNADSEWRDESWPATALLFLRYPYRPAATLMTMLAYPERLLARWDRLAATRRVVAFAAADAHARLWRRLEVRSFSMPGTLRAPSYESSFQLFALQVQLDRPLTGSGPEDGRRLLDALRRGHMFSTITALAAPARFDLTASRGTVGVRMGDEISAGSPLEVKARAIGPAGTRLRLFENGRLIEDGPAPVLTYRASGHPAVYRAEVWLPRRRREPAIPWIVSNPIFVREPPRRSQASGDVPGRTASGTPAGRAGADTGTGTGSRGPVLLSTRKVKWHVEHDARSAGRVGRGGAGKGLTFEYALGPGPRASQFAAAATDALKRVDTWRLLRFRARASRPMRLSVQVRQPTGEVGDRWTRSVYLDATAREVTVRLDDFRPVADAPPRIPTAELQSLLLVVDTVNTRPGTRGTVWLDDIRVE